MSDAKAAEWQAVEDLVQAERYEEAKAATEQFIRRYPGEKGAYQVLFLPQVAALYELERYDQVLRRDPTDGYTWGQKGQALAKLKRYEEALAAYEHSLQLAPQLGPTDRWDTGTLLLLKSKYKAKGEILLALKREEEAVATYEHLIQLDPTDGEGYQGKGKVFAALQREAEALALYEEALRHHLSNALAFRILELRQKLHHPLAPAGHLSADVLDHDLNGSRFGDQAWRAPASLQGAILDGQQGRYQVLQRLGDDLLTTSYRARDLADDRPVLVKVLYPRVLFYLATVAPKRLGLTHPHLERLLGYGVQKECCYLVTEDVAGPTLQAHLEAAAPLAVERAVELAAQIAQGLSALRQAEFSDGGLTTTTILLSGEQGIKLTDLGLLSIANEEWFQDFRLIKPGPWVSKPAYVAPENTLGMFGAPSTPGIIYVDLYTLACLFFELLSGHPPYPGKHLQEMVFQQRGSPIPSICALRPDLAPAFDAFFQKALAKQPDDRYQTPQALLQALAALPGARD